MCLWLQYELDNVKAVCFDYWCDVLIDIAVKFALVCTVYFSVFICAQ
jgi:hypothetical protein